MRMRRKNVLGAALLAAVPLCIALPVLAQRSAGADVERARDIAQLVQQGQLNLRDATALAERHIKGIALEATCTVQAGPEMRPAPGQNRGPQVQEGAQRGQASKRVIYSLTCFAEDKLHVVRVDALAKKVMENKKPE